MPRKPVAPTLARWLHNAQPDADASAADLKAMGAEFRALLRVVRAAKRDQQVRRETFPDMNPTEDSVWVELDRALAALDRLAPASKGGRKS